MRAALAALLVLLLFTAPVAANHPNADPELAEPMSGPVAGEIEGVPPMLGAGRFAYYRFELAAGAELTVEAEITPGDPVSASRAGFKVYGPKAGRLYAEGAQTSTRPSHRATFTPDEAGTYLLQLYNFNVTPIRFEARVLGLPRVVREPPRTVGGKIHHLHHVAAGPAAPAGRPE